MNLISYLITKLLFINQFNCELNQLYYVGFLVNNEKLCHCVFINNIKKI